MTSKAKLVYVNKSKVRPPEGTPEFDAWIEARSKARAKFYFDESRDVPDLAENTQFLCGSWDFLSQTDDEIDAENEAMEKAEELRKRENLKVIK
ncbi:MULTISPECIES: hypothetical protein [Pseudoalteromonas]|uniref:Uncharacterized protein n=1 Tax=Pseudoalteromonas prydzensis TaxID=182141 RepID=A0ABR9FS07_9GAMM|nr:MULTISPECIES: hypothetical protein [Pseudoalteromonas]MBE0376137.1 hypothetical protein [Pseudoalteromonas prydzensis ACAM 620]MBE0459586.1 hypothetical protein [Pseudoalteromonas prydzensis]WKD24808.1 hypothetical protein NDQ71_06995 [Pseudoalteromonas sp. KG3]